MDDEAINRFQCGTDPPGRFCENCREARGQFDLNWFSLLRTIFRLTCLDRNTSQSGNACTNFIQYYVCLATLVPFDEIQRNRSNQVFC